MKKELDGDMLYMETKCQQCKKKFVKQSSAWAFHRWINSGERYFCSWKCLREWEKAHQDKKALRDRIQCELAKGRAPAVIAEEVGATMKTVMYWKNKMEYEDQKY